VYLFPKKTANAPIGPLRVFFPKENSTINKGIDHSIKKRIHANRNAPPYLPANLGKRQIFPAPIAIPKVASNKAQRVENCSLLLMNIPALYEVKT
jgi:hypothetical protein